MTESVLRHEIAQEQSYVTMLYDILDRARVHATAQLHRVYGGPTTGTDQAATERDSFASTYAGRASQLRTVERGLCFGRIDTVDDATFYIGRIGLFDENYDPLLIDWRAPVAQPFYRATTADPLGLRRRRHIRLSGRTVVAVDDDLLDRAALDGQDHNTLIGEAALFASLSADRTGRMSEIVATIQAEQDAIIRAGLPGALMVQGGPGTGKTVVALHRAAYLLYTHRDELARRGVLVIGPNPTFLRYIEQCCRRSARPRWCCPPSASCSLVWSGPRLSPRTRAGSRAGSRWSRSSPAPYAPCGATEPGRTLPRSACSPCSGRPPSDSPLPRRSSPRASARHCTASPVIPGPEPTWRCSTRQPTCSVKPRRRNGSAARRTPSAPPPMPSTWRTRVTWSTPDSLLAGPPSSPGRWNSSSR